MGSPTECDNREPVVRPEADCRISSRRFAHGPGDMPEVIGLGKKPATRRQVGRGAHVVRKLQAVDRTGRVPRVYAQPTIATRRRDLAHIIHQSLATAAASPEPSNSLQIVPPEDAA
jgi:hypothetical protein